MQKQIQDFAVTFSGGLWIAVGQGAAGQTMTISVDGKNWIAGINTFSSAGFSVYGEA